MNSNPLPPGVSFTDPSQLPAALAIFELNRTFVYSDKKGIPTIGVGVNLTVPNNMALVLNQLTYNGQNVFDAAVAEGKTVDSVITAFERILASNTLSPVNVTSQQGTTQQEINLTIALNNQLALYFGTTATVLNSSGAITFSNFPATQSLKVLGQLLADNTVITGQGWTYPTDTNESIPGYSSQLIRWITNNPLTIFRPYISSASNLPPINSGQWEALVSYFYNSTQNKDALFGKGLLTALKASDNAEVWYQIRYAHLADQSTSRRYAESTLYGLQQPGDTWEDAVSAYQTLTDHRSQIIEYEVDYGTDPNSSNNEKPAKEILAAHIRVPTDGSVQANIANVLTLTQSYDPEALLIVRQLISMYGGALPATLEIDHAGNPQAIYNPNAGNDGSTLDVSSTNIAIAPSDFDISNGFASSNSTENHTLSAPVDSQSKSHILIGSIDGDTVSGGTGDDLIIAGQGNETLKAGTGTDTLISGQGFFGAGNDLLVGGIGKDTFVVALTNGNSGIQTIDDPSNNGSIVVESSDVATNLGGSANNRLTKLANENDEWSDTLGNLYNLITDDSGTYLEITGPSLGSGKVQVDNFNLSAAESSTGYLGIFMPKTLNANDAPTLSEGSLQTFSMSLDAASNVPQQLSISLGGADPTDFAINTGANLISFDSNGIVNIELPAGQSSITLALVNTGDVNQTTTLLITGIIGDPNSPLATSNTLSIDYTPGTPDPFVDPQTSTSIDPTEVKDPNTDTFLYNEYQGDGSNDLIVTNSGPNVVALGNGNDIVNDVSGGDVIGAAGAIDGGTGSTFEDYSGGNGNNVITLNNNSDVVLVGNGNNRIYGDTEDTNLSDNINAARSDDATHTQGALIGVGEGNNTIVGGDGNNLILSGAGDNLIVTGPGNDTLIAGVQTDDALSTWTTTDTDTSADMLVNVSGVNYYSDNYSASSNYEGVTDQASGAPSGVGNDSIFAGSGSDIIFLSNGDNYVDLGTGDSSVYGGMGNNSIFGGSGNILFYGGGGNDYIDAESGNDYLLGRGGNNTIIGGSGNDTIHAGGDGVNYATEESGDNYVEGGSGNQLIFGSDGNDTLIAGSGNTSIFGGDGNEYIEGGAGNDSLIAVGGSDTLDAGGAGNDTIEAVAGNVTMTGGLGTDFIVGGSGNNLIYSGDGGTTDAPTTVIGGSGDNTIYGGSGVNQIFAGNGVYDDAGSATIYGGTGTELIEGGAGVDVIYAGDGGTVDQPVSVVADTGLTTIYGGAGDDILDDTLGGSDVLVGGSGDDTIIGTGSDTLEAGSGNDFLQFETGNGLYKFDSGFGDDTIDGQSSSDTLEFGTQFSPDQLTLSAGLFSNGSNALVIDTGEGTIAVEGGLTGGLGNTIFDDPQTLSLTQLVQQASDVSTTVGGQFSDGQIGFLTFDTEDNDTLSSTGYRDTIAAFGNNDVLESGSTDESTSGQISASIIEAFGDGSLVYGGEGSDSLQALGANDTLIGGTGTDSFTVTDGSDVVQEAYAGTGSILYSTVDYTLPTNVETLILEGNSDLTATGNSDAANVIQANTGDDTLIAGQAVATLVGGSGNDTFVVNNTNDVVQGASAASTNVIDSSVSYVLPTNVNTLALTGTSNLVATANAGNDLISANLGNDTLVAGTGNDTLQGNYGSTTFDFTQPFGADQIVGTLGADVLEFGSAIPQSALTMSAVVDGDGLPALIIDTGEGTITIDGGLSGSLKTVEFDGGATYTLQQFLAAESFSETIPGSNGNLIVDARPGQAITGGSGKDTIAAFGNDDTLTAGSTDTQIDAGGDNTLLDGGVGNDTLNAFGLNDTLVGGSGNDTFIVDSTTAVVQDASSTSNNVLRSSASYVLPTDVDTLTLEGIADLSGTGNTDAANLLTGNAGNDTLTAGTGRDTLVAGTGLATLVGGAGDDTFVVNDTGDIVQDASTSSQNAIESSVSYVLPVHVDTLTLTGSGDLVATGNSDSSNLITANSGDDTLIAGVAIATLVGGAGNDTFVVNNAGDVVEDSSTTGDNTIESSVSYVLPTDVDTLTLTGTADLAAAGNSDTANLLTGNAGNDTLTAGSGSDTLVAGSGLATLVGGSGSDTFVINNVNDVVQDASTTASNAIESSVSYVLPTDVDTLTLTGSGDLTATGNADASNLVTGNAGNDTLTAGSGSDTLVAGSGLATLVGGSGNDTFVVDDVSDVVQDSSTTASNVIESSVDFVLPTNVDTLTLTGTDDLIGTGNSDTANVITANDGDDTLVAGTAIATLIGGIGNDTFVVNNAADVVQDSSATTDNAIVSSVSYVLPTNVDTLVLTGSANLSATGNSDATNLLVGADGQDTLTAGSGADTLEAGSGLATLVGGAGDDSFVVNNTADVVQDSATTGNNTVESSVSYVLPSNVDTLAITGTGLTATGNSDASNTIEDSGSGDSTLVAGSGSQQLLEGSAGDTYVINSESNAVIEQTSGSGTIQFGSAFNYPYNLSATVSLDANGTPELQLTETNGDQILIDGALDGAISSFDFTDNNSQLTVGQLLQRTGIANQSIAGGDGNLILAGENATNFVGGTGQDSIYGFGDNQTITGGAAGQVITDLLGTDTLNDGVGGDTLEGSNGTTYDINGLESDEIKQLSGTGIIDFAAGITPSDLSIISQPNDTGGTDLVIQTLNGSLITVDNGFDGAISSFHFSDGSELTLTDLLVASGFSNSTLTGGNGVDTVFSAVSYTLPDDVDNLILTGSSDIAGYANDNNDVIIGNSGNDSLYGGAGNDTLIAGAGESDTLVSGSGIDSLVGSTVSGSATTYIINNSLDTVTVGNSNNQDSIESSVNYSLQSGVNNLTLIGSQVTATDGSGNGVITGNGSYDTLIANSGGDTLIGASSGFDDFVLNSGNNVVEINSQYAQITANGSYQNNSVISSVDYVLPTGINALTLSCSNDISGEGNSGNDTLIAGSGNDTLIAGSSITYSFTSGLTTVSGANLLIAGTGTDVLDAAMGGVDTLVAGTGTDTLAGYSNDLFDLNAGFGAVEIETLTSPYDPNATVDNSKTIVFGAGIAASDLVLSAAKGSDGQIAATVSYRNGIATIDDAFSSPNTQFEFSDGSTLSLSQLEATAQIASATVAGANGNFIFNGDAGASITAGSGNDTIEAFGDNDTVVAGDGNDQIHAMGSNAILIGGAGLDSLYGGSGNTQLVAGTGSTDLYGGTGTDTYVLTEGGITTIHPSSTSGFENLYLPAGMSLSDFTSYRDNDNNLVVQSLSGDTTAIIDGYYSSSNNKTWVIESDNDSPELLTDWTSAHVTANSTYVDQINNLRNLFIGKLPGVIQNFVQNGFSLNTDFLSSYEYHDPTDKNTTIYYGGTLAHTIDFGNGSIVVPDSESDTFSETETDTTVTTTVPVYATETTPGMTEFVPNDPDVVNPILNNQQIQQLDALIQQAIADAALHIAPEYRVLDGNGLGDGYQQYDYYPGTSPDPSQNGTSVTTQPTTRRVQTGTTTETSTVPQYHGNFGSSFAEYNLVGDGSNGSVSVQNPDETYFDEYQSATFVGSVVTGDGNVNVNLGGGLRQQPSINNDGASNKNLLPSPVPGAFIQAGSGTDSIVGSQGDDVLAAGTGFDFLDGGEGADTYYVPLEGDSTDIVFDTAEDYGATNGYPGYYYQIDAFDRSQYPGDTLVLPQGVTLSDLKIHLYGQVLQPYTNPTVNPELVLTDGSSNVVVEYTDDFGYYQPDQALSVSQQILDSAMGIDLFKFSDGTTLTINQLLATATILPSDYNPQVNAQNLNLVQGAVVAGASLFTATDNSDNQFTYFQVSNTGANGGYFTLNGVQQAANQPLYVSADQLPDLQYVAGMTGESDDLQVSAFDGAIWSTPASFEVTTVESEPTYQAPGPNQTVMGGDSGPESIVGGYGGDTLIAGAGHPITFVVGDSTVVVDDVANNGEDSILSSVSYTLPDYVDNLTLTGSGDLVVNGNSGNDSIIGNTGNDTLIAGSGNDTLIAISGNDSLVAGTGNDDLISGTGMDTLVGGPGADSFDIKNANDVLELAPNSQNDTIDASVNYTLDNDINNLVLVGSSNLVATANNNNDYLSGNDGNSTLVAGSGNDTLASGSGVGVTTMIGGSGNDLFVVKNVGDTIEQSSANSNSYVYSYVDYTLPDNLYQLGLGGDDNLVATGNSGNDYITGNDGNDTLIAGSGNDTLVSGTNATTLVGGTGSDLFVINNENDVLQFAENSSGLNDTINTSVSYTLTDSINDLVGIGNTDITETGNNNNDLLIGNDGDDTLVAGSGNDTLAAGSGVGAVTMTGGSGNDTFVIKNAGDTIVEPTINAGATAVSYIDYVLPENVNELVLVGSANLTATANSAGDQLIGTGASSAFIGKAGSDTVYGGSGNSFMETGTGNDFIQSDALNNVISENVGDGNDTVQGASNGLNTLSLGGGIDYSQIGLKRVGDDLIVEEGSGDSITLQGWYYQSQLQNVATLQIIEQASSTYNSSSSNNLYAHRVDTFDFGELVAQFNQAMAQNPDLDVWNISNAAPSALTGVSDTAALGGDAAYSYGVTGTATYDEGTLLGDPTFGTQAQTFSVIDNNSEPDRLLTTASSNAPSETTSAPVAVMSKPLLTTLANGSPLLTDSDNGPLIKVASKPALMTVVPETALTTNASPQDSLGNSSVASGLQDRLGSNDALRSSLRDGLSADFPGESNRILFNRMGGADQNSGAISVAAKNPATASSSAGTIPVAKTSLSADASTAVTISRQNTTTVVSGILSQVTTVLNQVTSAELQSAQAPIPGSSVSQTPTPTPAASDADADTTTAIAKAWTQSSLYLAQQASSPVGAPVSDVDTVESQGLPVHSVLYGPGSPIHKVPLATTNQQLVHSLGGGA